MNDYTKSSFQDVWLNKTTEDIRRKNSFDYYDSHIAISD